MQNGAAKGLALCADLYKAVRAPAALKGALTAWHGRRGEARACREKRAAIALRVPPGRARPFGADLKGFIDYYMRVDAATVGVQERFFLFQQRQHALAAFVRVSQHELLLAGCRRTRVSAGRTRGCQGE